MRSRYDEFAGWYDTYVTSGMGRPHARAADRLLTRLLGPGHDRPCLDLGCGGGAHVPALTRLGWRVTGVDISSRQVELARRSGIAAMVADAAGLPFGDQSFDAVATIMTTTDFDDLPSVFAEAHRVLRSGGRLTVVAAHPCFGGAFVEVDDQGSCVVHTGYRRHERIEEHPLLGDGIRSRVGVVNVPLPTLLNAVTGAGFTLQKTAEDDGEQPIPNLLGLTAVKWAERAP
jgi:SAM-dependent methyltransferase